MGEPRSVTFTCRGHRNIRARHDKTIEFTRDPEVTLRGDCIVGVAAEFDPEALRSLQGKIEIRLEAGGIRDRFRAQVNPDYSDFHEIVFRKTRYNSPRTFGFQLNKGADSLKRELVEVLRDPGTVLTVTLVERGKRP